jgi:hypothetical protein
MMDYYLQDLNVINRLVDEWEKYGKLVIAYDFDNTVYDFHNKGYKFDKVIELLRECREYGAYFIVFTASLPSRYEFIRNYLDENNIPYDSINEDYHETSYMGRKIYYNILLDDRAGLSSAYQNLKWTLDILKGER